jgi:SAM-dependent methyltransferase
MKTRPANFDVVARPYRLLEYATLGRLLERTRFNFLSHLSDARRVLVIGDGDGRFVAKLLETNAGVTATAVDTSREMLHLLAKRCAGLEDRLQMVQQDALSFAEDNREQYDLIATHFFLDCLGQDEVDELVRRMTPTLSHDALWVVSDFRIPRGALRLPARLLVRGLYFAFRCLTGLRPTRIPNYGRALADGGFMQLDRRFFMGGMLTAELWQRSSETTRASD